MIIVTTPQIILYLINISFIFFSTKPIELWFSSVIRGKPYIFGAKPKPFKFVRSEVFTHWFQRKLTASIRTMVKRLKKTFGEPDRFPALGNTHHN